MAARFFLLLPRPTMNIDKIFHKDPNSGLIQKQCLTSNVAADWHTSSIQFAGKIFSDFQKQMAFLNDNLHFYLHFEPQTSRFPKGFWCTWYWCLLLVHFANGLSRLTLSYPKFLVGIDKCQIVFCLLSFYFDRFQDTSTLRVAGENWNQNHSNRVW